MSANLRNYKAMVLAAMNRAQYSNNPELFENSGPDHARIVLDVMLETACESVDVIAGRMSVDVWSCDSLRNFIEKNPKGTVRVLLDDVGLGEVPEDSVLGQFEGCEAIRTRWLPFQLRRHLCIADRSHVRLELNKQLREASITFGDPNGVGIRASEVFEKLWSTAVPLRTESKQYA